MLIESDHKQGLEVSALTSEFYRGDSIFIPVISWVDLEADNFELSGALQNFIGPDTDRQLVQLPWEHQNSIRVAEVTRRLYRGWQGVGILKFILNNDEQEEFISPSRDRQPIKPYISCFLFGLAGGFRESSELDYIKLQLKSSSAYIRTRRLAGQRLGVINRIFHECLVSEAGG